MRQLILLTFILFSSTSDPLQAQSQDLFLFGPGGNMIPSSNLYLSQSIGEPCVQETQNGNIWITEGFQQPSSIHLMVSTKQTYTAKNILVYPNPTTASISISGLELKDQFEASLINQLGQTVYTQNNNGNDLLQFNIAQLPNGIYLLHIKSSTSSVFTQSILKF